MKNLITIFLFLIVISGSAQFDDRFYYPKKEWKEIPDSLNYKEYNFKIGKEKLNGILLTPATETAGTIFFLHGAGGNITTYIEMTAPLVSYGFTVFMIDMHGYGKSTGTPTHIGIERDVPLVFDKVMGLKEFEGNKTIVYGASMGTQAAAVLARERATQIDLLIIDGGMSSFTDIALASAPEEQKATISMFVTSPYSLKEIITNTEGLKKWVIHSKEDTGVPYEQGMTVFEKAAEPKWMWTYKGEHLTAISDHTMEFFERLEEIRNSNIPPLSTKEE